MRFISIVTALCVAGASFAHDAPSHDHAKIVPIPSYSQPYGPASGAAAYKAAEALLASLSDAQKQQMMFPLDAPERAKWSNLPAGIVQRTGLSVGEMSEEQRALLFAFLTSSLGRAGYDAVANVMAAETFLSTDKRAERLQWNPENYWLSFYGTPSAETPWGWQFGGHHLGLNISIDGNTVTTMSPSFVGTEPAVFTLDGVDYEVLREAHRLGFSVYEALDEVQKAKADAGEVPKDVLTGPGQDGMIPPMIGVSAAEMSLSQKALLLTTINQWVWLQPDENAVARMKELADGIDELHFAWTGTDEVNTPTYMRIQGPTLIIEMLSTGGNVGESAVGAGHYHTMYRNPTKEYGQSD